MSNLKHTIQEDVKTAMKARDQHRIDTLRGLVSEIRKSEIDTRKDLTDEQVITLLQKEVKKRRDALHYANELKRDDLISQNNAELEIIQKYLGAQLSETELRSIILELKAAGNENLGQMMGALNKSYKGKFDGKVASELAREILSSE